MKRWWLPTQKGTELFPRTTIAPPKLVVNGSEPGSAEARALLAPYAGKLKMFHGKCQQDYALSSVTQYKRHVEWDGARATYINIGGQETITVEVDQYPGEGHEEVKEDYWDFAVVEIYVPDMYRRDGAALLYALAHMIIPVEEELGPGFGPYKGTISTNEKHPDERYLDVASLNTAVRVEAGTGTEAYASFTVDLRPARGMSVVAVDLHATCVVPRESFPGRSWRVTNGVEITVSPTPHPSSDWDTEMTDDTDGIGAFNSRITPQGYIAHTLFEGPPGVFVGWTQVPFPQLLYTYPDGNKMWYLPLPETYFDTSDELWKFIATGTQYYSQSMGSQTVNSLGEYNNDDSWWRHWKIVTAIGEYIPPFAGPTPIPADVQVSVFKGEPELDVTEYETEEDDSYKRFTYPDRYPNRPGYMSFETGGIEPYFPFGSPQSLVNVPKLGTLTIDLKTGGAFWQNAQN